MLVFVTARAMSTSERSDGRRTRDLVLFQSLLKTNRAATLFAE
jgi:hypothetical protein